MSKSKARKKKLKGSPNAGRPRKEGERYPSGKLKPPARNERVVAERKEMLGGRTDIESASTPMDLAHARGWLSTADYRAGLAFAEIRSRARLGGPRLGASGVQETSTTTGIEKRTLREMTDAEIAAVWDLVFGQRVISDPEAATADAHRKWNVIQRALTGGEANELYLVCVLHSWPQWMVYKARDKEIPEVWDAKRILLENGLRKVRTAFREMRGDPAPVVKIEPAPERYTGPKQAEHANYVNEDGELLYEVVRLRRGA